MSTMRWLAAALKPTDGRPARLQRRPAAAARRREMGREDLGRRHALRGERGAIRSVEVVGIGRIVDMLELAAAAFGEVPAGRDLMVRAGRDGAVRRDQVAGRGHRHEAAAFASRRRRARRGGRSSTGIRRRTGGGDRGRRRSGRGRRARPRGRAARRRRRRPRTDRRAPARRAAMMPARTSPVPALASQAGAGGAIAARPSGAATTVSAPL